MCGLHISSSALLQCNKSFQEGERGHITTLIKINEILHSLAITHMYFHNQNAFVFTNLTPRAVWKNQITILIVIVSLSFLVYTS